MGTSDEWDDEFEDDTAHTNQGDGPEALRKAYRKLQKDLKVANTALEGFQSAEKQRVIAQALQSKGVSPKVASLMQGVDATPEAVDAWLSEYSDVFGIKQEEAPAAELPTGLSPAEAEALKSLQSRNQTNGSPSEVEDMGTRISNADTPEALDAILAEARAKFG